MISIALCEFPVRIHPVSAQLLEMFLDGNLAHAMFQRFFSLPNSDYIPLAECIIQSPRAFTDHRESLGIPKS